MNRKDVYEHLAKIYLDASSKHRKKERKKILFRWTLLSVLSFIFILGVTRYILFNQKIRISKKVYLTLVTERVKINFNSQPAKEEAFIIKLDNLDLTKFKILKFLARKADLKDSLSLRVEFKSLYNEVSAIYIKDIPYKWKEYALKLSDFKEITDWSKLKELSFIIEEWNVKNKKNIIYLDEIILTN